MGVHVIKRGLDLPLAGRPDQKVLVEKRVARVALVAEDYPYMKPRMLCAVGDVVKRGQVLFEDRKTTGVRFTAPGAGTVVAINRGDKRALISVVIELSADEQKGAPKADELARFESFSKLAKSPDAAQVRALLSESGLWTALRARPYGRVPGAEESCDALFVTAIDTRPHAADPAVVLAGHEAAFAQGLAALATLTEGPVFVCAAPGLKLDLSATPKAKLEVFEGKHPAGLPGTHIHFLAPISAKKTAWHLGYQDVIAVGELLKTGVLPVERVISLAGPAAKAPRLVKTRLGASVDALVQGEVADGEVRVISGSVLYGRKAVGEVEGYLGRYDEQVALVHEDRAREFLGWLMPGFKKFSTVRAFFSGFLPRKLLALGTSTHGSERAMVPIGMYEKVMPLDIMPTFLLRSLLVGDVERAEELGALELIEEDLSLCSFVSTGKEDFGPVLRALLTQIRKEG